MPDFWYKQSTTWRKAKQVWYKDGATWRAAKAIWYNDNGIWRQVFEPPAEPVLSGVPTKIDSGGFGQAAVAAYTFKNDGTHTELESGNTNTLNPPWLTGGTPSDYEVRFETQSGDSFLFGSSAPRDTWLNAGTTRELLTFGSSTTGVRQITTYRVLIREIATQQQVASTGWVTLETIRVF